MNEEQKRQVAIFRFGLIHDFDGGVRLERGEQQRLLREKCGRKWSIPFSSRTRLTRSTVLRWIKPYRESNKRLESLYPKDRSDRGVSRGLDEETSLALIHLRKELPRMPVPELIKTGHKRRLLLPGTKLSLSTVYRLFHRHQLMTPLMATPQDRRKFESELPNDLWQSDPMHGPQVDVNGRMRKTDVQDSEWLCRLLRSGLVSGSFIPPRDIRELRDLTRHKRKLIQAITAEKQRVEKVLEDANIKLASIASDTLGASGKKIIEELIKGELEPEGMAELSKERLRQKRGDLKEALVGEVREHHKFMIKVSLKHIRPMEKILSDIERKIQEKIDRHYKEEYELLQTIPGVKGEASTLIAEMGVDMERFPSEEHLSSWAGMSPGDNESGGKKKPRSTTYGNKCLKTMLTEFAWVASKTKDTYLRSKYHSLVGRRGKKKALVALGHKILIMCYHILKYRCAYRELGID
jgi:transposase